MPEPESDTLYVRCQLTWPAILQLGRDGVDAYPVEMPRQDDQPDRTYLCFVPAADAVRKL
jgi:hypothetical protein